MKTDLHSLIGQLAAKLDGQYGCDFLQTWDKNDDAIAATCLTAQILKRMHQENLSPKVFDSGLAISIFKDQSTRTRYSFDSSSNLLGLMPLELDLGKSQVTHGEATIETVNMISFLTRVIGIRDDVYLGVGQNYIEDVVKSVEFGHAEKVLHHRPTVVNLQSDTDHPTQSLCDLAHLIEHFGGAENLRGKKLAMTWAYSPKYGKPLSVPQGIVALMTRFGMDVSLAYPEGYHLIPEIEKKAAAFAQKSGGSFHVSHSMEEAFRDADIVYPKSWASYAIMEERTKLLREGNTSAYKDLESKALAENATHKDWECTERKMDLTRDGKALYMHCLPADISGVNCKEGEVEASVFVRYRKLQYMQAGNKPYVIAAMILLGQFEDPVHVLKSVVSRSTPIRFA